MVDGPIAGAISFSTALDNSDLEKGLQEAEQKVEELKQKIESKETEKSSIEQQMDSAKEALEAASQATEELRTRLEYLQSIDISDMRWTAAQQEIQSITTELKKAQAEEDKLAEKDYELEQKWHDAAESVREYTTQLESAKSTASTLSERVGSTYYQAGVRVREAMNSASSGVSSLGSRISGLASRAFVFSTLTSAFSTLKSKISEALQQNNQFSASWEHLGATVQGFANGIANVIAPALASVVNAITACITTLARAIDTVFKTGLVAAINSARTSAESAWRETDESKAAAKQNEKNAEQRAKQQGQYAKQQENYAKQQQAAAERQAKAEEAAAERRAKAAQKYPDALEDAAEKQAKAEEDMRERIAKAERKAAERQADAEEKAQERYAKAQESAAERQAKAEASAAERTAAAQEAYEKKVAKAEQRQAEAATKAERKQQKQAEKLQKAQDKANRSLIGFDEITKLNEESTEDLTDAVDDYTSATEEIEPPKVYTVDPEDYYVDPSDYVIDPEDYAIDYEDYQIDPEDFFVDPEDYEFDPSEYMVDPSDYSVDPFEFDWTDYPQVDTEELMKPNWDAFDVGKIDEKTTAIMAILTGALLAVGAILAFSGINIPLGLALMAVGALGLATIIGENWEKLPQEVRDAITDALVLTGIVLIVLGAVIAFSGANPPLGIGMMVAGLLLEYEAAALNWDSLSPEVQGVVTALLAIISGAFLVIGAIIAFGAVLPDHKALGVALMIAGAAGLVADIMLNWGSMDEQLKQTFTTIMVTLGLFAIVIGVVLLLAVPGQQALGIGLILTGATLLGGAVALNWDSLGETVVPALQKALDAIGKLMIVIGVVLLIAVPGQRALGVGLIIGGIAALEVSETLLDWENLNTTLMDHMWDLVDAIATVAIVLGTIFLFVPGHLPMAIGLIIFGIAALTIKETAVEWDSVENKLELVFDKLVDVIAKFMIILGVVMLFVPMKRALGIGLIIGGIGILVIKEIAAEWDSIKTQLEDVFNKIIEIGAALMACVGFALLFGGVSIPIGLGLILAGITVFAVNAENADWEWLKNKLTEYCGAIVLISSLLLVIGIILCFSGVGIPLGLGLIAAGAIGLASELVANWDFILDKLKEIWSKIVEWFNNNIAPIFTADWWFNLFKSIFNGLIDVLNNLGSVIGGWLDDLSYNLGQIVGASGGTYTAPAVVVPHISPLAEGAVIPANRKFLALMGDQRHGTNLETPEALMRQVVREEAANVMADMMLSMQAMQPTQTDGEIRMILRVGEEDLAEAVHRGDTSLLKRGLISPSVTFA